MLDNQEIIDQETRGFDVDSGETLSQRSKESAFDYRYFPEPDLPPIEISEETLEQLKKEVPEAQLQKRIRYQNQYQLAIDEVNVLSEKLEIANFFESAIQKSNDPKKSAAIITTYIVKFANENELEFDKLKVNGEMIGDLVQLINDNTISFNIAKNKIINKMLETGKTAQSIIEEDGLKQVTDHSAIETWCKAAIEANPKAVEDVKGGNNKAIGALVGFVMKESKGQANPGLINKTLVELLK